MATARNLLVELFVEELPPKALKKLGEAFADAARRAACKAQGSRRRRLARHAVRTPRRLAVHITRSPRSARRPRRVAEADAGERRPRRRRRSRRRRC